MANKDIKQAEAAKIKNIIMKNTERYVDYDEECPFESRRVAEPDELAEKLYNAGYHKTIWHKVADRDLPKETSLYLCKMIYNEIYRCEYKVLLFNTMYGFYDNGLSITKDEVIAWTELPEYKE